ncbi:MAG: Crp/Fnr family transcriptional regulator [Pseudomonadota bacterium]
MSNDNSCLISKLSHYVDLDVQSRDSLARLEAEEEDYDRACEIYGADMEGQFLYVVKHGWLYSYIDLPDGRRQIVKIHHPGDIIGFQDIAYHQTTTAVRAAEACVLCPFPKKGLTTVFSDCPQLAALLFAVALRDHTVLVDTIRAIGRMSAMEKIAHMLLDLQARLRITNTSMTDTMRLPLNQSEIGDFVGLTNVYVSRTLMRMEEMGLISRDGINVTIKRENDLARMADFTDRYRKLDTSWFPDSES